MGFFVCRNSKLLTREKLNKCQTQFVELLFDLISEVGINRAQLLMLQMDVVVFFVVDWVFFFAHFRDKLEPFDVIYGISCCGIETIKQHDDTTLTHTHTEHLTKKTHGKREQVMNSMRVKNREQMNCKHLSGFLFMNNVI